MTDYLDDLLTANQELGDENNIFGAETTAVEAMMKVQEESGASVIDYKRYDSIRIRLCFSQWNINSMLH